MSKLERTPELAPHRTPRELADAANVSMSAVLKWIREGRIKSIPFGATHRIPAEEFDRILEQGIPSDRGAA